MNLNLTVLASTSIKRKKPWPKVAWLGKDKGALYLLDKSRVSQLYLPSGKTQRKIPSVHPFLVDVQALCTSPNGLYLAGALRSGKVFVWDRDSDSLHTTPVLDKIRNVLGTNHKKVHLFIANCGKKIVLLSGYDQLFLWETETSTMPLAPGEPFSGSWVQIQSGDYTLPCDQDKETAIDGIFHEDHIHGLCCLVSWVFNKQDRIHITTVRLQWLSSRNNMAFDYDAKWLTFYRPLYGLTPAKRVMKSNKAYVAKYSSDGQILAVAMNQKVAMDTRLMFYLATSSSVAVVTDLKGCGSANVQNMAPTGKLWWVSDMAWTNNNLFLIIITRCGSLAVLTKLGEPVAISTSDGGLDMGPAFYLPLHPRISFKKPPTNGESDSSLSLHSETDSSQQRYSLAVHPNLPIILSTDGYLVTVMQLPGNATYKGVMVSFMSSVSRLVPEVQQDSDMVPLSTSIRRVNIFQSEANLSRVQSAEEISENTQSSCSSSIGGYGLASGDQGMAFMPIIPSDTDIQSTEHLDFSSKFLEAQLHSLKALAVGMTTGPYWSKDVSSALNYVIKGVVKLFSIYLHDHAHLSSLLTNSSFIMLSKFKPCKLQSKKLQDCYSYFKMALEFFLWDCNYRNGFTLSLRLINGIAKEILGCRSLSDVPKIAGCISFLELSKDVLGSVYSWKQSSKTSSKEDVTDRFSPNKSIPRGGFLFSDKQDDQERLQDVSDIDENLQTLSKSDETSSRDSSTQIAKALSAPWTILYNYTAQASKRHSSLQETGDDNGQQVIQLMCDIQKKLQDIGVSIPTDTAPKPEHMTAVASLIERDEAVAGLIDSPGNSLFGRRKAHLIDQEPNQSTPVRVRKTVSLDRLLDVSSINKSTTKQNQSTATNQSDTTTETLLAILYLNLQEYNLRAALDLILSLLEPALDHLDTTFSSLFTLDSLRSTRGQENSSNQLLSILVQTFPILRVSEKVGLPVVQSLARFMAAYFSNLDLYVFPAYHPNVLPPYYVGEKTRLESTSDESFALSQGAEVIRLDRERVALSVRDQGLSDVWCANNAIEIMLIAGLISEASWLSNNLGDWKHSFLLSTTHTLLPSHHTTTPTTLLHALPHDITPENIILTQLQPILTKPQPSLSNVPKYVVDAPEDATSTPNKERVMVENRGAKAQVPMDDKAIKDVSTLLQAAVIAGIDVVPGLCWTIFQELLVLVSQMDWIVPDELYLPAPPLYCPQPSHDEKEFLLPRVYREKQLRTSISATIQKLLTLLHSSNCMAACMQWYVSQLSSTNQKWYNVMMDDQDFIMPQSLLAHGEIVTSFHAADLSLSRALKKSSAKQKDIPSPTRPSKTPGSSVNIVISCFHQFCSVMWLLHTRDKMSQCARKYRQARKQADSQTQLMSDDVESLCWETLQWTLELQPFSSFLDASAELSDALLTLLSEMPPSIATAQIAAQYFPDPNLISTTSGRAKFKRLMAQYRGITLRDAGSIEEDNHDEPLSVYYREKCLEWEDELKEREKVFYRVQEEVFPRKNDASDTPHHGDSKPVFNTNKDLPCVGSLLFETSRQFLDFLDTFFIITFTKNATEMTAQATTAIPLLLPYEKLFIFNETRSLKELQMKAAAEREKKPPIDHSNSLYRSQSYSDVRSNRSRQMPMRPHSGSGQTDMRKASSMGDVSKTSSNSGIAVLGTDLLELLPKLAWLNRWSSEGVPTTSINRRTPEGYPIMKVDVELALLTNSAWLIDNVYIPWEQNEQVNPEFLKAVPTPAMEHRPNIEPEHSIHSEGALRRVSSDSNIPKVTVQSPTTEDESVMNKKEALESRKKLVNQQEQGPLVKNQTQSDIDFKVPHPVVRRDPSTVKTKKKSKPARRALNLDLQDENLQIEETTVESAHTKPGTRRKKKISKSQRSSSKTSPTNQSKTATDHELSAQESTPMMTAADVMIQDRGSEMVEVQTPQGSQPVLRERAVGSGQPLAVDGGMEFVLLLRPNTASQTTTGSDVPLLKLSTVSSTKNHQREPATNIRTSTKTKEVSLQTDSPVTASSASQKSAKRLDTRMATAVDFSAQYNEARNVSCQTGPASPMESRDNSMQPKFNEVPHKNNYSMQDHLYQFNGELGYLSQLNGLPSKAGEMSGTQFNGIPSRDQLYVDGVPRHRSSHFSGVPTSQHGGVPSNQPYQDNGTPYEQNPGNDERQYNATPYRESQSCNEGAQGPSIAWPDQHEQNPVASVPLLHFEGRSFGRQFSNTNRAVPPFTGIPPFSNEPQGDQNSNSFPLLKLPREAISQPMKSFRLFEIPPASRDLPFLCLPKNQEKQNRPDLNKIKFAEVKTTREPCVMLQMDNSRSIFGEPLVDVQAQNTKAPLTRNVPGSQSPMVLLHMPKEEPKPNLIPIEVLEDFEKSRHKKTGDHVEGKENVKPKKIRERKRKRQAEQKEQPRPDVTNNPSRQRRRQNALSSPHPHRTEKETHQPNVVRVKPASQTKQKKKTTQPKQHVQLEKGLSEESDIELSEISNFSDEEQLYVQPKPTVSNYEVDKYCRELEERVKKQFEKELEELRQQQMELEVKERVRKEMEKERDQREVSRRIEEERKLIERLEQEKKEGDEKLQEKSNSPRPAPRKRSVKWQQRSFVYYDEDKDEKPPNGKSDMEVIPHTQDSRQARKIPTKTHNSVEIQTQGDIQRQSVDQVTQTTERTTTFPDEPKSQLTREVSGPQSFAPVLPPDIFLGLTFTRDGDQNLGHEGEAIKAHEFEAEEAKQALKVGKESGRQFISVADINAELWEKIHSGNKIVSSQETHGIHKEQVDDGEESVDEEVFSQEEEQPPSKHSSVADDGDDVFEDVDEKGVAKPYDPLTVKMMGSLESQKPTRPTLPKSSNTHSIAKQRLSAQIEEMNERFEAIEKITQNMDREFQSSKVLLSAIDDIGEIMSPSTKERQSTRSTKLTKLPQKRVSSRMKDNAPWRRDRPTTSRVKTRESLNDTDEQRTTKVSFQDANDLQDRESIEEKLSLEGDKTLENEDDRDDEEEHEVLEDEGGVDDDKASGTATPTDLERFDEIETRRDSRDTIESRESSRDMAKPRDSAKGKGLETRDQGSTVQKQQDNLMDNGKAERDSIKDVTMLSSDTLKEIFADSADSSIRVSQRSAEKRKKVQDWMARKRKERHSEWKSHVEELRSTEFKPFTGTNEGPSTLKKIKLAEKERETKRRTREETQVDERIKDASNLINEMLAEPIPKSNTLKNLRYAPPPPKSKHNNRYNTKPFSKKAAKKSQPIRTQHREPAESRITTTPLQPNSHSRAIDIYEDTNRYGIGTSNQYTTGARSVTPGSDFVTTKTYRMHEKDKLRRSHELEKELSNRQQPTIDINGLYNTAGSLDIDGLMDQIPDGSTIDEDGLDELLSDDSELKELLTGVLGTSRTRRGDKRGVGGMGVAKKSGTALMGTVTLNKEASKQVSKTALKSNRNIEKGPQKSYKKQPPTRPSQNKPTTRRPQDIRTTTANRLPSNKKASSSGVPIRKTGKTSKDPGQRLDNFDDISPWNTGDSLKMSDDVAQLLAEAKEAIGDDISESSGSIMSNIDWEAVDKIMNDM